MDLFVDLLKGVALPAGLLYLVLRQIVIPITDKYMDYVDKSDQRMESLTRSLDKMADSFDKMAHLMDRMGDRLDGFRCFGDKK